VSKGQNELICMFKIGASEMISIGEVGYEVHVHSNRNYKEFVRLDVECEE
jgi:hypothetical protein